MWIIIAANHERGGDGRRGKVAMLVSIGNRNSGIGPLAGCYLWKIREGVK